MHFRHRRVGSIFVVGVLTACSGSNDTVQFSHADAASPSSGGSGGVSSESGGVQGSNGGANAGGAVSQGGTGGLGRGGTGNGGFGGSIGGGGKAGNRGSGGSPASGGTPANGGSGSGGVVGSGGTIGSGGVVSTGGTIGSSGNSGSGGVVSSGGVAGSGGVIGAGGSGQDGGSGRDCQNNGDCTSREYCDKAVGGCADVGVCKQSPVGCSGASVPVCGCDRTTYGNACQAAAAGVSVMHRGACPSACDLHPIMGCCFDDADCATGTRCVTASCAAAGDGVCETASLAPGACWDNADCGQGALVCKGANICACGVQCPVADSPGKCAAGN
jgi:hypothetical protein